MRQVVIRVLNTALIALCSFQGARMVNLVATEALQPPPHATVAALSGAAPAPSEWKARKRILDRNLFGAKVIDESHHDEPEVIVEETIEETKLPLLLEATIVSAGGDGSRAAIHDTRSRSSTVLSVGDTLENYTKVKVALIERGRVLLSNGGRHEELLLHEPGLDVTSSNRTSASAATARAGRNARSARARRPPRRGRPAVERERPRVAAEELTLEEITREIELMRELEAR